MILPLTTFLSWIATDPNAYTTFLSDKHSLTAQYLCAEDAAVVCGDDLDAIYQRLAAAASAQPAQSPAPVYAQPQPGEASELATQWSESIVPGTTQR